MKLECFGSLRDLPAGCAPLFGITNNVFSTALWYQATIDAALPPGTSPCFAVCTSEKQPVAMFPMQLRENGSILESLTTCYSCAYSPLFSTDRSAAFLHDVGLAFGQFCRAWPTVRIDALPDDWADLVPFLEGAHKAGIATLRFDHFGAWHMPVKEPSWNAYVTARPRWLQEAIRRRTRKVWSEGGTFTLVTGGDALEPAIAAYESVYARSWKTKEPFPAFNSTLMRRAALSGLLRLGLLHRVAEPIAVQFWLVTATCGVLLKLAHDQAYKSLSPGTVLTALMIRHLVEQDHVAELDFGRGDDPYKALWAEQRRQHIGVLFANPLRWRGLTATAHHLSGALAKSCRPLRGRRGEP